MEWWNQHGFSGFVLGQPGQKLQESLQMLRSVYEHQTPKVVILETNALYRAGDGKLQNLMDKAEAWANRYIVIYRGHDIWKSLVTNKDYSEENYNGFGFRCKVMPYTGSSYMKKTERTKFLSNNAKDCLKEMADLCAAHGTRLILVSSPSPKNYNYRKHNGIAAYAEELGVDYLDMNLLTDEIGIDWSKDELDGGDHLNLRGARKTSLYLGDYLNDQFDLPDRRSDENYQAWQKEYECYARRTEEELAKMKRYSK